MRKERDLQFDSLYDKVLTEIKKDLVNIVIETVTVVVKKPRTDAELKEFVTYEVSR